MATLSVFLPQNFFGMTDTIKLLENYLLSNRNEEGVWDGELSSSAISTSVACFALHSIDKERYAQQIKNGVAWLHNDMKSDGSWGDSRESPSNMTATLLSYAALFACDKPSEATRNYLIKKFGGSEDDKVIKGVLDYYGTDLTFSAPILVMCAAAGVIKSWSKVPQLPFGLARLPQSMFRFLRLPVVSYAIPALIAVGILRHRKGKKGLLYRSRERSIPSCLRVLAKLQPSHGGFLEAAPLTGFTAMCLAHAGFVDLEATQKSASFLVSTVREDGSWPIDTDLAQWNTSLAVNVLGENTPDKEKISSIIKKRQFKEKHPFTGAIPGGWGWTGLPGAVPDADDTSAALVALHHLDGGLLSDEIINGINWLLELQNSDGGIPTFAKGWGKLPFDRSSPDISAHTLRAFAIWKDKLSEELRKRVAKSSARIIGWLAGIQADNGSLTPLWFGDQEAEDESSPVYGTAVALEHLAGYDDETARKIVAKGIGFLKNSVNEDGGWGGNIGVASKLIVTSRVVIALVNNKITGGLIERGGEFIVNSLKNGVENGPVEPIGLYFARLWYSEKLYGVYFPLLALKKIERFCRK